MALASTIASAISSLVASLPEASGVITYSGTRSNDAFAVQMTAAYIEAHDDILSDDATLTDRRRFKFFISLEDWAVDGNPRPKDIITLADGTRFAVLSFDEKARSMLVIMAREVA